MVNDLELRIVSEALADANAKESGALWYDYQDMARNCIAAFDALTKHREALALEKNKAIVEGIRNLATATASKADMGADSLLGKPTDDKGLIAMAAEGAPPVVTPLATLANADNTGSETPAIQTPTATVTSIKSAKGKPKEKVPSL